MDVRQEMLDRGRRLGGTHFIIVDADEVPTGNLFAELRTFAIKYGAYAALEATANVCDIDHVHMVT